MHTRTLCGAALGLSEQRRPAAVASCQTPMSVFKGTHLKLSPVRDFLRVFPCIPWFTSPLPLLKAHLDEVPESRNTISVSSVLNPVKNITTIAVFPLSAARSERRVGQRKPQIMKTVLEGAEPSVSWKHL